MTQRQKWAATACPRLLYHIVGGSSLAPHPPSGSVLRRLAPHPPSGSVTLYYNNAAFFLVNLASNRRLFPPSPQFRREPPPVAPPSSRRCCEPRRVASRSARSHCITRPPAALSPSSTSRDKKGSGWNQVSRVVASLHLARWYSVPAAAYPGSANRAVAVDRTRASRCEVGIRPLKLAARRGTEGGGGFGWRGGRRGRRRREQQRGRCRWR